MHQKDVEQFKNQFNALCEMYEEVNLDSYEEPEFGEYDEDGQLYDIWVREFCRQAPNKELRLWLEGQAAEIYKETSANNSFDCIFSFKFGRMEQIRNLRR